jgi:hypothetical protein
MRFFSASCYFPPLCLYLWLWKHNTHSVQVFQTCHDTHGHFPAISWGLWTGIKSGSETFTDFLDSSLKLISLEEYDEYWLEDIIPLNKNTTHVNLQHIQFEVLMVVQILILVFWVLGDSIFLRNIGTYQQLQMVLQPQRPTLTHGCNTDSQQLILTVNKTEFQMY